MAKNTGLDFEDKVYEIVHSLVASNKFLLSNPYVKVHKKKSYYSKDRESNIICDITVEKYMENPDQNSNLRPSIVVVIECKDYAGSVPVDDVEEFHAKLQQIGADNTKGIMMISGSSFQSGALKYAKSKHIGLARILPDNQVSYFMYKIRVTILSRLFHRSNRREEISRALTQKDFRSGGGQCFFSLTEENSLEEMIGNLLK